MMLMWQVEPTETDKWTKVEFASAATPIAASYVVISVEAALALELRVTGLTADACIPLPRKCSRKIHTVTIKRVAIKKPLKAKAKV